MRRKTMSKAWDIRVTDSEDDNIRRTVFYSYKEPDTHLRNLTRDDLEELFWELHDILGHDLHG
jgi:hypothetical protein